MRSLGPGRYVDGCSRSPVVLLDQDLAAARVRPAGRRRRRPGGPHGGVVLGAAAAGRWSRPGSRVAIPEGYAGFVQPRSGLAWRHGITLANSPGLIDAGYRDELAGDRDQYRPGGRLRDPPRRPDRPAGGPAGGAGGLRARRRSAPVGRGASVASATPGGRRCPSCPRSRPCRFLAERVHRAAIERAEVAALSALKTYDPPVESLRGLTMAGIDPAGQVSGSAGRGPVAGDAPGPGRMGPVARQPCRRPGPGLARARWRCGRACPAAAGSTSPSRGQRSAGPLGGARPRPMSRGWPGSGRIRSIRLSAVAELAGSSRAGRAT